MKKNIFFIASLLLSTLLWAQNTNPCAATWLPSSGTLSATNPSNNINGQYVTSGCNGTEENPLWYRFIPKTTSNNFTIQLTGNCKAGNGVDVGLSVALFRPRTPNCEDLRPILSACASFQDGSGSSPFNTMLIPNQLYYLQVDGLNGSECPFTINYNATNLNTNVTTLRGKVVWDKNSDCKNDVGEPSLGAAMVILKNGVDSFFASSDKFGAYNITLPFGTYEIYAKTGGENRLWTANCTTPKTIILNQQNQNNDFLFQNSLSCPVIEGDIASIGFANNEKNKLYIAYRNIGTATALNAKATLLLDPNVQLLQSSLPFSLSGKNIVFELGNLAAASNGSIELLVKANNTLKNQQAVVQYLSFSPSPTCFPNTNWNGTTLSLTGTCEKDSVYFWAKNKGNTTVPINGLIIEDHVLIKAAQGQNPTLLSAINPNDSVIVYKTIANGKSYRADIQQVANYPFASMPSATVEGCRIGATGNFSVGYANMFPQDDVAFHQDVDVREVEENNHSSTKFAFPKGYQSQRYIAQNQDIEYLIRFKNTSNSTIKNLYLIDTLSNSLDPTSVRIGGSNFPFSHEISNKGVLQFKYTNIQLTPSANNQDSVLFVKYRISQRKDVAIGSEILSKTAFYTAQNENPTFSPTLKHRVGSQFLSISLSSKTLFLTNIDLQIAPNPFTENTFITVKGLQNKMLTLELTDNLGRIISSQQSDNQSFEIKRENLQSGFYFFQIKEKEQLVATGKLIAR